MRRPGGEGLSARGSMGQYFIAHFTDRNMGKILYRRKYCITKLYVTDLSYILSVASGSV